MHDPPVPAKPTADQIEVATMENLLQETPLHAPRRVTRLFSQPQHQNVAFPDDIRLYCDHEHCEGVRRHRCVQTDRLGIEKSTVVFATAVYKCTNCNDSLQVFVLRAIWGGSSITSGACTKIYQEPVFGQPIPKRLFEIIGESNREHFLQARRAIARGLGIGAYGYYRRIVESTKFDLVDSVLNTAKATNAASEQITVLQKAQSERQFSKAIEMLRNVSAIPAVLLIDGHNPLALLHDALSEGIHQLSDAECLARAQEAELILCEIAERTQIALTERRAVKAALASITNRTQSNKSSGK